MLSRLLEAGPAQFSAPLAFVVAASSAAPTSAAPPVSVDSTASANTGPSALTQTHAKLDARVDPSLHPEWDILGSLRIV